ncbi:MAG TPA: alanyl-tRNA editing protein, partial [Dongiaceae bacterium]|nr:alanyl-tRNA editing protein [Dongiaceae bacterium]
RTVFYPMGGGQPGDVGFLHLANGDTVEIADTVKGVNHEDVVHVPKAGSALPQVGDKVHAEIDWERRYRLMRMHTCLHLLSAVIKGDVTGGQVGDGKGRLDFNLPDQSLDKDAITEEINRLVSEDHEVKTRWITDEEMAAQPELVRTMSVKPPTGTGKVRLLNIVDVDLQPCGGTHVARTGEIGAVEVTKIENKGKMNRRVNLSFVVTGGL